MCTVESAVPHSFASAVQRASVVECFDITVRPKLEHHWLLRNPLLRVPATHPEHGAVERLGLSLAPWSVKD